MNSSEGARPTASEAPKSSELSVSSSVCRLGKNQEAACAGKEVHMGYLERGTDRAPLSDAQKKENAQKVAQALNGVKKAGREATSAAEDYKAEDVLNVENIIQELTGEHGPYAGILFQCPSPNSQSETGINSACLMTIVAHELASSEMRGKPQNEVIPLIQKKLHDTLGYSEFPGTIALIDKKGNLFVENSSADLSMVIIDSEGKKTTAASGTQLKSGEKIVIADTGKVDSLDGKKPLQEMMEGVAEDHAVSGSEIEKEQAVSAPVELPVETLVIKKVTYEDDRNKPHKVEEYIQTTEYQQNREWLNKVIEKIQSSTDPTIKGLKRKNGEDELVYTKRVVGALQKHLSAVGENEDSPLSRLAAEAEDVSSGENPDRGGEIMTLDAISLILKKAPELYDSKFKTPETEGNPEEVKSAFSEAFDLYEAEILALVNKDIATLSNEEKEIRARFLYTKSAYERAKGTKNWQLDVELRAHGALPSHMIVEGVPVEGVMFFLQAKIDAATAAGNQEEVAKFQALYDTLKNNSRLYREVPLKDRHEKNGTGTKFKKIDELMEARQQLEANQRHLDLLRTSHNQNDQARMQEDWDQGGRDLEVRRELVVPKKAKTVPNNLGIVYEKTTDEREIIRRIVEPDPIEPAPEDPDRIDPPIAPPPPIRVITENDLQAQVVVAKDDTHMIRRNNDLVDHMMSKAETSGTHWYSRVPLLGGVVGSLLHPVQNIWRNGLARESVREQNRRFVDRMGITLKSHFVGREGVGKDEIRGQMRIPVEVTSELIDRSLEEGKKLLKKQGLMTRLWWGGKNAFARITTLGETSQMHFAKQWLGDNLIENVAGGRDPLIEAIFTRALKEQDAVASRIAIKGLRIGEKRVEVSNSPLAAPIKDTIAAYFAEMAAAEVADVDKRNRLISEARTRLVAKVNTIGKGSSGGEIDLSTGIELASNILSVVDDLSRPLGETGKSKWQVLQEEDKWKDFKINITTAESRWGAEGGDTPMSKLRENVLKRMAERELFVGENERTHGVELALRSITSDIATYGGAFLLGAGTSSALFGARTVSKLVGGLGGIMGMSAAKEMGLRVGGKELFRGRYRGEVAQVSKETALGKKGSSAARIRGEMGKALVEPGMMENADTIAVRIESLLTKDPSQMTEREAYQILREIAQLDARMRIADISGTKDLQFTTQNYIIYDELQRNEQYLRLKSNVLVGLQKLTLYKGLHSDFGHGEDVSSGIQIEYGKAQGTLGMFEKFSVLAEAQLRLGSRVEVLKWLQDTNNIANNNAGLGMGKDDAQKLMNEYYSAAKGTVDQEQSIRSKERVLRRLATKRAATVVLQSALMMPIGGAIVGVEYQMLSGVVQEVQHAIKEGIPAWSNDWAAVISGNGTPTHALSPFQTGVLTVRHTIENATPTEALPAHDEVIDGIHVQLPARYKYERVPDGQPGAGNDRIVDAVDGHVVKDLSGIGLQIDANGKLVEINGIGQIVNNDALADFRASGISIHQGDFLTVNGTETVLNPIGVVVDQSFDGHTMHVPEGTEWIKDAQGNSDLVVMGHHDVVLIDNAQIGADGLITGGITHEGVTIETATHTIPGESGQEIHVSGPDGILTQNHDTYSRSEQQNMYGGTVENGYDVHRPIYDYKETNPDTGDAVYVIQAGRGEILYPAHDPNITFNVPQEMVEGHLYFTLTVPGHGNIVMPANYSAGGDNLNDALRLDPSDTTTFVTPQGHEFTYGEVAKMFVDQDNLQNYPDGILGTEYNNIWSEILHLTASDSSHPGTIASSILGDNGVLYHFGVVRGGAPLQDTISTESPPITTTESLISIPGPINTAVTENVPTFIVDAPAVINTPIPIVIPLIPVPMGRENVEAVEGGSVPQERTTPPVQTPPSTTPPVGTTPVPTTAASAFELSDVDKEIVKKEVDSRPYSKPDDMLGVFGLKQGTSFGKYNTDDEKRESNLRYKDCQKALSTYEAARRAFENAPQTSKKQKELELKKAKNVLINTMKGREGKLVGAASFGEAEVETLNTFLDEQKQKRILEGIENKRKNESLRLTKMFTDIDAVPTLNHDYVVREVPQYYVALDQRSAYELPESFFVEHQNEDGRTYASPNNKAASYVFALGEVDLEGNDKPENMQNKRYIKAEEATNGDSGVFAVAAASAEEPKDQAKLYKFLSGSILAVHGHNPALLEAWLHNQTEFSMNMFIGYDDFKDQGRTIPRTDKNERLLERNQDGGVDTTGTVDMWKTRITELEKAIKDDNLQPYHLRWIEFLAHSVDVPGLIKTARGRT